MKTDKIQEAYESTILEVGIAAGRGRSRGVSKLKKKESSDKSKNYDIVSIEDSVSEVSTWLQDLIYSASQGNNKLVKAAYTNAMKNMKEIGNLIK